MEDVNTDNGSSNPLRFIKPDILAELNHLDLSNSVTCSKLIGAGSYGDVFKGQCLDNTWGRGRVEVAIKRLRFHIKEDIIRLFEKEIYVWSKLKHPNILPLLGFAFDDTNLTGYPLLVSEWMKNGTAWSYVNANPDCDVLKLITGIANGMEYLHDNNTVHSDLKSDNVVISDSFDALICDFGCARIVNGSRSLAKMSSGPKGTSRYLAYELVAPNGSPSYSFKADVWAFGITVLELFTRHRPYHSLNEAQVLSAILSRESPFAILPGEFFSSECQNALKDLCLQCWNPDPGKRIDMSRVQELLHDLTQIQDNEESMPSVDSDSLTQINIVNCQEFANVDYVVPARIPTERHASSPHVDPRRFALYLPSDMSHITIAPSLKIHRQLVSNNGSPAILYDVTRAPSHDNILAPPPTSLLAFLTRRSRAPPQPVPAHTLALPATRPFVPSLRLSLPRSSSSMPVPLPRDWVINAVSISTTDPAHTVLTNLDVLHAVYSTLREPVSRREWAALGFGSNAQRRITRAFANRCERSGRQIERDAGVRRVDYLCERTMMCGIKCRPDRVLEIAFTKPSV